MNRVSSSQRICEFIQRSAIKEVFDERTEYDMALEYLSISQDYVGDLTENAKVARAYCKEEHTYIFNHVHVSEFYPLIRKFIREFSGYDFEGDLMNYLKSQTTLDDYNITVVINAWKKQFC